MLKALVFLDKTDITVKTPMGSVQLAIAKHEKGHAYGLWAGSTLLDKGIIPPVTGKNPLTEAKEALAQSRVIVPLLLKAKDHLTATVERYPQGLEVHIRVEHKGQVHEIPGRIPLDSDQLAQLMSLVDLVRKVNTNFPSR